jgi:hypothetical protein
MGWKDMRIGRDEDHPLIFVVLVILISLTLYLIL